MTQKTYTAQLKGGMIREFTSYATRAAARATIHESLNPVLVRLADGSYDAFPQGHPLPVGAEIIERCILRAGGMQWVKVTVVDSEHVATSDRSKPHDGN